MEKITHCGVLQFSFFIRYYYGDLITENVGGRTISAFGGGGREKT